jgi:hypothetical protein
LHFVLLLYVSFAKSKIENKKTFKFSIRSGTSILASSL